MSNDMDILEDNLPKRASDCISVNAATVGPQDRLPAAGILVRFKPCHTTANTINTTFNFLTRIAYPESRGTGCCLCAPAFPFNVALAPYYKDTSRRNGRTFFSLVIKSSLTAS